MKRIFLAAAVLAFAPLAMAQTCNVTYSVESETADGFDAGTVVAVAPALPMADVLDNADKFKKVMDRLSKDQEHGGPYTVQMDETRDCAGKVFKAQGIEVRGLTLAGATRAADVALLMGKQINDRYKARVNKSVKTMGWDHTKAKKVERDDVGKRK